MKNCILILLILSFAACTPKSKGGEKSAEEKSRELFEGNFQVGEYEAIVYVLHRTFEVEMQIFGQPMLFYFDKVDDSGNFIYRSDDQSMFFAMKPNHKSGTFHEINEPDLPVTKE